MDRLIVNFFRLGTNLKLEKPIQVLVQTIMPIIVTKWLGLHFAIHVTKTTSLMNAQMNAQTLRYQKKQLEPAQLHQIAHPRTHFVSIIQSENLNGHQASVDNRPNAVSLVMP